MLLVLATAAAAASYFYVPLFYGLQFGIGLVAVLLALVWLGWPAGLLVAAVQAGVSTLLYDHPYVFALLGTQVAFLAPWLRRARRRGQEPPPLPLLIALYWVLIGAPLALLYGLLWVDFSVATTLLALMKQGVADLVSALLAELVLIAVALLQRRRASVSNRRLLFVLFTAGALLPACALTLTGSRDFQARMEQELVSRLQLFRNLAAELLPAAGTRGGDEARWEAHERRLETLLAQSLPGTHEPEVQLLSATASANGGGSMAVFARRGHLLLANASGARPISLLDWEQVRYHLILPLPDHIAPAAIRFDLGAQVLRDQVHVWLRFWLAMLLIWAALAIAGIYWLSRRLAAPLQAVIDRAEALPALIDSGKPMPPPPTSPIREEATAARALSMIGERLQASFSALARERDQQREQRALRTLQAETLSELVDAEADERQVAEHLCQRIAELLPRHHSNLVVLNTTGTLEVLAAPGLDADGVAMLNTRIIDRPERCAYRDAFETGEFAAIKDFREIVDEPPVLGFSDGAMPAACWCEPIRGQDGHVLGVLGLAAPEPGDPSRFAKALLEHGAALAAVALSSLQLRREHRVLIDALSQAETGIVIAERRGDGDHPIRFVNKGFEDLTGYSSAEVLGHDCRFLQGSDRDQPARHELRAELAAGRSCQSTLRNYRKDGSLFWNSVNITPVRDAQGTLSHFVGIQRDDTERLQALERLSASEAQLREITETIEEVFWVQDVGSERLSYVSRAFEVIWERPLAAVIADASVWRASLHPSDRDWVTREQADAAADGRLQVLEYRILTPDGRLKWIADRRFLVRDRDGRAQRIVGVAAEITDRKSAEKSLREQRQRLEQIIEGTRVGTWDWRLASDEIRCNERWAEMLGYRLAELQPTSIETWREHVHPDDGAEAERRAQAHLAGELDLYEAEFRMRHKEGHWVWVQATGRLVERDADGTPKRMLGIHLEISERKQAELDLIARERLERELVHLTTSFVDPGEQSLDALIQAALAKLGALTDADRAYLFQTDSTRNRVTNSHEWVAAGIEPMIATLQDMPTDALPNLIGGMAAGDPVLIPRVADLPADWATERALCERQQTQSVIVVPLMRDHRLAGFVGLDAVRQERSWLGGEVHFLRVLAGVLVGALERERVLAELRASTERYDALALQSRMMTWEVDLNGVYTYINPVVETLLGYPPETLVGQTAFYELIPEPERSDTKARAFRLMQEREPCRDFVCPLLTADGRKLWTSADGLPILGDDGELLGYRGSTLDITDVQRANSQRRAAEQALQRYATDLERLVDLSNRGLDATDEAAALLRIANDALGTAVAETGWRLPTGTYQRLARVAASGHVETPELAIRSMVDELFADLSDAMDRPQLIGRSALPSVLRGQGYNSAVVLATLWPGNDGEECCLLTQLWGTRPRTLLSNAERELLRLVGQRIAAIEHEAQLADDLEHARQRETIGHLASGVAHDFNNVLAVLGANTYYVGSLLQRTELAEDSAQVIDEMNSVLGQAKVITSGMLALSRAGGVPLRPTAIEPPLSELADILRMMLPEAVECRLHIEPGLTARTNAGFLQAALLNLALNGRDAMPEGGMLHIAGERGQLSSEQTLAVGELPPGDYALISVSDTGTGMTDAVMRRIFEPLFSTKTQKSGHGLGMFMVREFIVRSGAGLVVTSTLGAGTRFQLMLPLAELD